MERTETTYANRTSNMQPFKTLVTAIALASSVTAGGFAYGLCSASCSVILLTCYYATAGPMNASERVECSSVFATCQLGCAAAGIISRPQ